MSQRSALDWIAVILERAHDGTLTLSQTDLHAMRVLVEAGHSALSPREQEVMQAAGQGKRNAEIAAALVITPDTVRCHLKAVYRKLGLRSRVALIRYVVEREA